MGKMIELDTTESVIAALTAKYGIEKVHAAISALNALPVDELRKRGRDLEDYEIPQK